MDQRGYIITNKHVINDADQTSSPYRMDVFLKRYWLALTLNRSGGAEN